MSFEFQETLTIAVPDVEHQLSAFSESHYRDSHGLVIEVAAIHEGLTANYNMYTAEALEASLASWVNPYGKPIIKNHDPTEEALGRVIAARMERESDGTPYVMLQAAITSPDAISKILDKRYLTGSVGGKAKEAVCSICSADWANASLANGLPCRHRRGNTYKGKLAYMEMKGIEFKEYSIVNIPADSNSSIRSIKTPGEEVTAKEATEDTWVRPARFFSLNMNQEEIVELSESASGGNLLESMSHKEAAPVYMQIKGAFLSALATERVKEKDVNTDSQEETNVSDANKVEDDDILAVSEELSSDLADLSKADEELSEESEEATAEETSEEEEEAVAEDSEEVVDTEEKSESEEEVEETEEEQEDAVSEDEDEDAVAEAEEEETVSEDDADTDAEEEEAEETGPDTELIEKLESLESRVEELETSNATLLEQNAKLKDLLKQNLAERVVDAKINAGLVEADERAEQLEEHTKRSAGSLADSLRDLAKMPKVANRVTEMPTVESTAGAVGDDDDSVVVDAEESDKEEIEDPVERAENILVETLMGRRKL